MPRELKTEWKRIGRSGPTVDGRTIEPVALRQAAANYDPDLFTALMWPEHNRWYNMGKVEALRVEDNSESGVDLFAKIAPNQYYLDAVKAGQKLFTSMELLPNFRDTGEVYLTGCAATDNPASAATSEMRFSASKEQTLLLGAHSELTSHNFNDDDESTLFNRLTHFFKQNSEDDMNKKALEKLQADFTALQSSFTALQADTTNDVSNDDAAKKDKQKYASADSVAALVAKFAELEAKLEGDEGEGNAADVKYAALQTSFDELLAKFNAAMKEQAGTPAGDHVGDGTDASDLM